MRPEPKSALSPRARAAGVRPPSGRQWQQPNEMDWRRIERALEKRVRYRYVRPVVEPEENGYRITSPCCSRNIDPSGGCIDIARLEYDELFDRWILYSKDHARGIWVWQAEGRLHHLMVLLNADPQRTFWQ